MSATQLKTAPSTIAEMRAFFDSQESELSAKHQRQLKRIYSDDEAPESEVMEDLQTLYDSLPKPKKARKKKESREKTAEEIAAEQKAIDDALAKRLLEAMDKICSEGEEKYMNMESADLITEKDGETGEKKAVRKKVYKMKLPHYAPTASEEFVKEWNQKMRTLQKVLVCEWLEKQTKKKTAKTSEHDFRKEDRKARGDDDIKKNEIAMTGDSIKCEKMNQKKEGEEYGGDIQTYALIDALDDGFDYGVKLEEDESCLYNFTKDTNKVQIKDAMRKTPIHEITGCHCATTPNFFKNVWKVDEDGVWKKQKKDWGCAPCNMKVVDGLKVCARHQKAKPENVKVWTRDMLKVEEDKIMKE